MSIIVLENNSSANISSNSNPSLINRSITYSPDGSEGLQTFTNTENNDKSETNSALMTNGSLNKKDFPVIDTNLFTFKPKLNPKSIVLAKNVLDFYERQNQHSKKQLELLEEAYRMSTNEYGKMIYSSNNFTSSNEKKISNINQFIQKVIKIF